MPDDPRFNTLTDEERSLLTRALTVRRDLLTNGLRSEPPGRIWVAVNREIEEIGLLLREIEKARGGDTPKAKPKA